MYYNLAKVRKAVVLAEKKQTEEKSSKCNACNGKQEITWKYFDFSEPCPLCSKSMLKC